MPDFFDFQMRTRVVRGLDAVDRAGALAAEVLNEASGRRVLLVTDPQIMAVGHAPRAVESLKKWGADVAVFDQAQENPTTDNVEQALAVARDFQPQLIVGIGGGSSMDCAKGVNFLMTNGGRMQDYWGVGKAKLPMLPAMAFPTTGGTGSEMQSFALISDATTHVKMACGDVKASFKIAVLDPKLTVTQPPHVTALAGIDAVSHALETYVTTKRNAISNLFSRASWRLLANSLPRVQVDPTEIHARADVQLGAAYAGLAIENSMLGACHALANPLTATFGIPHGQAIAVMLPHVIRFNGRIADGAYRALLHDVEFLPGGIDRNSGAEGLAEFIKQTVEVAGLKTTLSELGVAKDKIDSLAADASTQWTGQFNPREVEQENLGKIYEAAW